jgi:tetratricopeptide (TPR) repeat protein
MKLIIALFMIGLFSACASAPQAPANLVEDPASSSQAPRKYNDAAILLAQGNYKDALAAFDAFLRSQPTSPYTQVANFNAGRALEGLERWSDAVERYRQVVQVTNKSPRLQALALYQLSFPYEAMNDDPRTVATLIDCEGRKQFLPDAIATAELPARLASAYARVGNLDLAMKYYSEAESGIARLHHQTASQAAPEWLAKTLYLMGRLSLREMTWDNFDEALRPVQRAQLFLLQAIELENPKWSEEALTETEKIYDQMLEVLKSPPKTNEDDQVLSAREAQKRQWDLTEQTLECARALRAARPPNEIVKSGKVEQLFTYVKSVEKKLMQILAEPPVGEGLTKESKERRMRVRGKVVAPDDTLEKQYSKKKSEPTPTPQAQTDDPNI